MLSGFSSYLPEDLLTVWDNLEFLIRILMAALLGLMIGLERSRRQKDAGIRTHCIIAVTSATIMILSKYAFMDIASVDGLRSADPARIAAQVVSGISFLGAGVIFKDRNSSSIKGLTTAAGMWATSAAVNHSGCRPAMSYKKGKVAIPPPTAKSPVLKNSKNNVRKFIWHSSCAPRR